MHTVMKTSRNQRQRERWRYIGLLAGGLLLLVTFGVQLILLMPTKYTATSAIALRPLTGDQTAEAVEMQAHEYSVALGARETAASVEDTVSPSTHRPKVTVKTTQDPGTSTVRIAVTSTDKQSAVAVANGLVDQAQQRGEGDSTIKVVTAIRAGDAGVVTDPPRELYLAALVAVALLLLGGGLYQIRERTS